MKKKEDSKRDKILNVTLQLLRQKSIDEISIREIIGEANVNVASINYYFGSKEILFNEALDLQLLSGIHQWIETNINYDSVQISDLKKFIYFLHQSIIQHPSIARTRIINLLNLRKPNQVNLSMCEIIYKIVRSVYASNDDEKLKIKAYLLYASLANISISLYEANTFLNIHLENEEDLNSYIDKIIHIIFNKE